MLEWIPEGLPQTKGYWIWWEVDSPHSSISDIVYIHELDDYKLAHREEILKKSGPEGSVYIYENNVGTTMVICWAWSKGSITKPCISRIDGRLLCDWAPFNFPGNTRKFDPPIIQQLTQK